MTFYNQMVPGNPDDVERVAVPPHSDVMLEWHGGPREQGGYAVARHADGSLEAVNEARGRYEQACGAVDINMSTPVPQEQHEAPHGPVDTIPADMRTITVAGVQLTVDPTVLDDFELLESLAEIQRGDILVLPTVFRAVAGDKAQELLDALRGENGRVTATAAAEVLVQIMRELNPKA
jgi:hypothetical protein